ncbi:hypothetical protein AB5J52_14020 [Streptomyces sp. R39]|uniref:PE-PGRS family protein n=1 Tax=Streptomyces sp. R39 TaxID=3238631 RepID=A0AB39QLR1_9ACTN
MSTPAERAAVLRQLAMDQARTARVNADRRHMPDGGADAFARAGYWEQRTDDAFAVLDEAATAWRVAGAACQWADEDPDVILLGQQRDAAEREYRRCRNLRDDVLDEIRVASQPLPQHLYDL